MESSDATEECNKVTIQSSGLEVESSDLTESGVNKSLFGARGFEVESMRAVKNGRSFV